MDLLVKCKRAKLSSSIIQPQQTVAVSGMENEVPDFLPHKVSAGKDPMNRLVDSAVQSNGDTNGCAEDCAHGTLSTGNESARSRLLKICSASGWKEPVYDVEEQGPPHAKLFTCKVTVHVEGPVHTVLECFGDPKREEGAAQEHTARGALWCLAHFGRGN